MKIILLVLGLVVVSNAGPLNYDETGVEGFKNDAEAFPDFEETPRPPQVHHNTVKAQGPFSGRLINVLLNENGTQDTRQKNQIQYNINGVARNVIDDYFNEGRG